MIRWTYTKKCLSWIARARTVKRLNRIYPQRKPIFWAATKIVENKNKISDHFLFFWNDDNQKNFVKVVWRIIILLFLLLKSFIFYNKTVVQRIASVMTSIAIPGQKFVMKIVSGLQGTLFSPSSLLWSVRRVRWLIHFTPFHRNEENCWS